MKERKFRDYIYDILENSKDIIEFTKGMEYNVFIKDKKTIKAVVRSLEIIGEAAKHVPVKIKNKYTDIPWSDIICMRNRLIHGYFGVDIEAVWQTVILDIPDLLEKIKTIIEKEL